jgi:alginate O-acetyltransferase complex protein AlgI
MFFHPLFAVSFLILLTIFLIKNQSIKKLSLLLFSGLFYYCITDSFIALSILLIQSLIVHLLSKKALGRKIVLWTGVILLLTPLIIFKYKYFWLDQLHLEIDKLDAIKVMGISFFTFQSLSMLIDCYKGVFKPTSILDTLTHITFFPSILSGPISSPQDFIQQLDNISIKKELYKVGIYRVFIGVTQKLFFASYLGLYVDSNINNLSSLNLITTYLVFLAYTAQIYFDFAGYSNLVIGLANILGFNLQENFKSPYMSLSIKEFWNRWHMSLSFFFKKYIYISLGGNKLGLIRSCINVLIVMLICGMWHGTTINYIYWGLYNGLILALISILTYFIKPNFSALFKGLLWIFNVQLIIIGWTLFRLEKTSQFSELTQALFNISNHELINFSEIRTNFIMFLILFCFISQISFLKEKLKNVILNINVWLMSFSMVFLFLVVLYLSPEGIPNFIYFKY